MTTAIRSKLPSVGTTIFSIMSQLSIQNKAINLGQGFPDFNPDKKLIELVSQAMLEGYNQYPQLAGFHDLLIAISEKIENLYGHRYSPETEITITSGATEALMSSILALCGTGDEVIIIEPFYDLYLPAVQLAGATPVVVAMDPPTHPNENYKINWEKIRDALSSRTRLLIINTPHNPTTMVFKNDDLNELESIVNQYGINIISDEVYEHIVFNGNPHLSMSSRPALAEKSVVISSFGKTYHVTGWKIGYCAAPKALMTEIRKVHQFAVFTVSTPMQVALSRFMGDANTYANLSSFYEEKKDYLSNQLRINTPLTPYSSEGSFFLLASYADYSDLNEYDFCHWLTTKHRVTAIPLSAFYCSPTANTSNNKLIRLCFAKNTNTLDEAIARLKCL